jgi:hypothetical protein
MAEYRGQIRHSAFRTDGLNVARCRHCGWVKRSDRLTTVTSAATRHIDQHPDHEVITTRTQTKRTFMRAARPSS